MVIECEPAARVEVVMVYVPPLQVAEPTLTPSEKTVIMSPFVQEPVKSGVASFVRLSVLLEPVSVATVMSGALEGAAGTEVSIVNDNVELDGEWFPAASTSTTAIVWEPSLIIGTDAAYAPDEQVAAPIGEPSR